MCAPGARVEERRPRSLVEAPPGHEAWLAAGKAVVEARDDLGLGQRAAPHAHLVDASVERVAARRVLAAPDPELVLARIDIADRTGGRLRVHEHAVGVGERLQCGGVVDERDVRPLVDRRSEARRLEGPARRGVVDRPGEDAPGEPELVLALLVEEHLALAGALGAQPQLQAERPGHGQRRELGRVGHADPVVHPVEIERARRGRGAGTAGSFDGSASNASRNRHAALCGQSCEPRSSKSSWSPG